MDGEKITLNIYEDQSGSSEDVKKQCLLCFTMKTGEKFLIYEHGGKFFAEEKKRFYHWKTISEFNVNPHKNMRKDARSCRFCPF